MKSFFTAETHPLNLAIFRMALFGAIFSDVQISVLRSFSRMPAGLRFAPWGMSALLPHLPIRASWATAAGVLVLAFSAAGFFGFFSRTSALACALLGLYAFGIPNFYGKTDHNHHLVWFAAILAASPCGAVFSLDAWFAARRRAASGRGAPAPTRGSALPLRVVMLLTGLIYFFPGFWKLREGGLDGFLTDNLGRQLRLFWTWSFDGRWLPASRVDQHLLLCRLGAAATIVFELSFVFLIFFRRFRVLPAIGGVVFHALTWRYMRISFLSLQACYVAFVDWAATLAWMRRVLAARGASPSAGSASLLDPRPPFAFPRDLEDQPAPARWPEAASVIVVGSFLLVGAAWAGAARRINGWPFACYPTFSAPTPEQIPALRVVAVAPSGEERAVRAFGISQHRYYGLARNILAIGDVPDRNGRLLLLWKRAVQTAPDLGFSVAVRFYEEQLWIDPGRWGRNPASRNLLFEWRPPAGGGVPEPRSPTIFTCTEWQ